MPQELHQKHSAIMNNSYKYVPYHGARPKIDPAAWLRWRNLVFVNWFYSYARVYYLVR